MATTQTTYIKLDKPAAGDPTWEVNLLANMDELDLFLGKYFIEGVEDPDTQIASEFVGQRLIELDGLPSAGGKFVRVWIAYSRDDAEDPGVAGSTVWITEEQQRRIWTATQLGVIQSDVIAVPDWQIELADSNFFRFVIDANMTFREPQYNGVDLSLSTELVVGTNTASFQIELEQGVSAPFTVAFDPLYWAFPNGGTPPVISQAPGDIDILHCTVRLDGKIHAGYSLLSV